MSAAASAMPTPAPRLRRKLLLILLAILLPSVLAGALTLYFSYQSERRNAEKFLAETARALSLAVDRQLGQAEATLFALAASPHLKTDDYVAFDAQARASLRLPDSWVLLESRDRQLVNTLLSVGALLSSHNAAHWQGKKVGEIAFSNLFTGTLARQPLVAADMLLEVGGERRLLGILMRYQALNRILGEQGLPPSWIGAILDRNGVVIARSRDAERYVGEPGRPDTLNWIKEGKAQSAIFEASSLDGVKTMVAYQRSMLSGWTLLVAVPLDEVTRTAWQSSLFLIGMAGALLGLGVLMAGSAARSIAKPIEALASDALLLGRGEAPKTRQTGLREADAVAEAMQETAARLRAREDELRSLNAALAARAARSEGERDRLFDLSNDLFAVAGLDGVLKVINPAWEHLLGRDKVHLLATPFVDLALPDDQAPATEMLSKLAAGHAIQHLEIRMLRASSEVVWVSWAAVPEGDHFYAVGRDVTAAKEQELALLEANRRLELEIVERERAEARLVQAQKIEALGQLTGGIAHDFNNLLTVFLGNLDMLKRAPEERRPRLIANALSAVEQGRRLTAQLLAFGRRQTLKPEWVDLNALIVDMQDMLAQSLRGDIRIELDLADELWPVKVDTTQLRVALINLAANARDAMPKGGVFRLRTRNTVLSGKDSRRGVVVEVSDTGSGMSPDVLARAFDPFFTTKGVGKGTGLGLAQVHGFAQQSEGTVDLRSEAAHGTTVTLTLPVAEQFAEETTHTEAPTLAVRTARILLVEDNPQVAELAQSVLTEQGHVVTRVADAAEALRVLDAARGVDLVFSDIVMPGPLNGLDLAREIRRRWPNLSVLLATGYNEVEGDPEQEGFPLLRKPYRPEELSQAIGRVLVRRDPSASGQVIPLRREV